MNRILVVEDQSLVRDAIATLLSLEDDFEISGKCANGQEALDWLGANEAPDIILTDIEMPLVSGLDLAEKLAALSIDSKVVVMTTFSKPGYIKRALALGAKGFVLKEADSEYLVNSLHKIVKGERVISPELALMALNETTRFRQKKAKH